jgi:hypothetical protein
LSLRRFSAARRPYSGAMVEMAAGQNQTGLRAFHRPFVRIA